MSQQFKRILLVMAVAFIACRASAFSLLGPYTSWQVVRIGYNLPFLADIGGPMNLGEEYRWNVPTIYYGYDESFLNYFGAAGTNAIEQAFAILNALPAVSAMSSNLTEFPLDTKRVNYQASALGIVDLKSTALSVTLNYMGLAGPERYVWTLRQRTEDTLIYTVIKRNFDPLTFSPSSYVNGTLYTYVVQEFTVPATYADATELQVDPLQVGFSAVASGWDGTFATAGNASIGSGEFYTGLTRDDVGGLRYLYRPTNYQFENLLAGTTASSSSGSPWNPVGGTNATSTNNVVNLAVRPGVDKITFKMGKYDSLVGTFITTTNAYTDKYVTNSTVMTLNVQRVLTQPDLLILADDLTPTASGFVNMIVRTDTAAWINNDAINGQATLEGPGVIPPQRALTFTKIGPYFVNQAPSFLDELNGSQDLIWGSFDGSTNAPIIYPNGTSIQDLEQQVLFGGGSGGASPWTIPNSTGTVTNSP